MGKGNNFKHALVEVVKQNVIYRYCLKILAEQVHVTSQNLEVPLKWRVRDTLVFHRK